MRSELKWLPVIMILVGCTPETPDPAGRPSPSAAVSSSRAGGPPTGPARSVSPPPAADPTASSPDPARASAGKPTTAETPGTGPARFAVQPVLRDIGRLAVDIGPREATSTAYAEAARLVRRRFVRLGYEVSTSRVPVPAGVSWGTDVPAATTANVIATLPGFDPLDDHVIVGAHLDTVPVAPGAEDNASGAAMLLELARLVAADPAARPVRFIAFGAEEPRGTGDDQHHFGSRRLVARLGPAERDAVTAMVALDRVGVGSPTLPICNTPRGGTALQSRLRRTAERIDVPTNGCTDTASDHWSFAKASIPAVRLGSVPYAGYHSAADIPAVISPRQLRMGGRLMWAWLRDQ